MDINAATEDTVKCNESIPKTKLYKKRWLVLFIFSINSFANAALFASTSAINDIMCRYYKIQPQVVDWAANSFTLIYIFIAIPSAYCMNSFGIRTLVLIGSSLNAIATCLHFAASNRDGIYYLMAGQVSAALSVGAILQVPVRLSTVWFPLDEHAKATSIAMVANVFGIGMGFVQPTHMVPDSQDMNMVGDGLYFMYLSQMIFLLICLVLAYLFFEEKPRYPPSYSAALITHSDDNNAVPSIFQSIRILATDVNIFLFTQSYGIYFAMYTFYVTCLNEMVKSVVPVGEIGWMGFLCDIFGIIGILVSSAIIDKYKIFQKCSLMLTFGTLVLWTIFVFCLLYLKSAIGIFLSYSALGFFGVPFFAIGVEYVAELTYPIPEGLSSAIILIVGNAYGFIMVFFLGALIDKGRITIVCYITIGLCALSFLFLCRCKQVLRRHKSEEQHTIIKSMTA